MKSDFVGSKDGFNFICEADFIRVKRGFHRALRDFIEISEDLRYNQLTNKNMLHTSLLQREGDNIEIIIYDR